MLMLLLKGLHASTCPGRVEDHRDRRRGSVRSPTLPPTVRRRFATNVRERSEVVSLTWAGPNPSFEDPNRTTALAATSRRLCVLRDLPGRRPGPGWRGS